MNPDFACRPVFAMWLRLVYIMKLHRYVPAVLETEAGIPFDSKSLAILFIGIVARYAAGPVGSMGRSAGLCPAASEIEKSATFIAIRSMERSSRPGQVPDREPVSGERCPSAWAGFD